MPRQGAQGPQQRRQGLQARLQPRRRHPQLLRQGQGACHPPLAWARGRRVLGDLRLAQRCHRRPWRRRRRRRGRCAQQAAAGGGGTEAASQGYASHARDETGGEGQGGRGGHGGGGRRGRGTPLSRRRPSCIYVHIFSPPNNYRRDTSTCWERCASRGCRWWRGSGSARSRTLSKPARVRMNRLPAPMALRVRLTD